MASWLDAYSGLVPQRCLDDLAAQDRVAVWQERLARVRDATTIALCDAQVVGLATVGPLGSPTPGLPSEELRSLYVVRALRGRGLGQALLRQALAARPASLWTFEDARQARRFYALAGWSPTGERRSDDWTGVPEVRLVRTQGRVQEG